VDDMVINMIDVGEETGDLDTMLYKITDVYDEEVNVMVESLISLLEPLMIVFLGFVIGSIVIALFLPLIKLHIPILGRILQKTIVARTMRTLGTLVASGVPILESLSIVRETCTNAVFERMYQRVYESIREGDTIAQPLKESRLVDDMVINMIDVGEETGDLDTMLYKIADVYEEEVNVMVESLISLLEPLMIVFLGGVIGSIVIALFLPMIKLLEGLSK
jgi:type IV pilus assembly protein PilC